MIKKVLVSLVALYIATVFLLEITIVLADLIGGLDTIKNIELKILNKISFNNL